MSETTQGSAPIQPGGDGPEPLVQMAEMLVSMYPETCRFCDDATSTAMWARLGDDGRDIPVRAQIERRPNDQLIAAVQFDAAMEVSNRTIRKHFQGETSGPLVLWFEPENAFVVFEQGKAPVMVMEKSCCGLYPLGSWTWPWTKAVGLLEILQEKGIIEDK